MHMHQKAYIFNSLTLISSVPLLADFYYDYPHADPDLN